MTRAGSNAVTKLLMMTSFGAVSTWLLAMDTAPDRLASGDAKPAPARAGSADTPTFPPFHFRLVTRHAAKFSTTRAASSVTVSERPGNRAAIGRQSSGVQRQGLLG
ncbi:MAG: hypothetical protein K0S45_1993 [Nitrospira sp.]|jgi:hypothetical protein|nr:hypothetical protein [Nitrospira sp.]